MYNGTSKLSTTSDDLKDDSIQPQYRYQRSAFHFILNLLEMLAAAHEQLGSDKEINGRDSNFSRMVARIESSRRMNGVKKIAVITIEEMLAHLDD